MSEFTARQQSSIEITMANLNEQVSETVSSYLRHLDENPEADLLTDLQSILIDMIGLCTVAYIAADKLLTLEGPEDASQDA